MGSCNDDNFECHLPLHIGMHNKDAHKLVVVKNVYLYFNTVEWTLCDLSLAMLGIWNTFSTFGVEGILWESGSLNGSPWVTS